MNDRIPYKTDYRALTRAELVQALQVRDGEILRSHRQIEDLREEIRAHRLERAARNLITHLLGGAN